MAPRRMKTGPRAGRKTRFPGKTTPFCIAMTAALKARLRREALRRDLSVSDCVCALVAGELTMAPLDEREVGR